MGPLQSKIKSIFGNRCPRCLQGSFYVNRHPFQWKNAGDFHEHCDTCGLKYEIEPHFFQGAMFVTYTINVAWFILFWILTEYLWPDMTILVQILTVGGSMVIVSPLTYWWSKPFWLNLFIRYERRSKKGISK